MNRILIPLTFGFKLGVALREAAYRRGWLKVHRLDRPVISVGNLSVGGTGKTPLVAQVARGLLKRGFKPAVLTRGYGRRSGHGQEIMALSPGAGRAPDPREVGDEPALLARALPELPIVVGADRYRAGRVAEDHFHVNVHILDDGFQHFALARDLDIVAIDATQPFSDDALLPAGRLREPCSALRRAHVVVLTRVELREPEKLEKRVIQIHPTLRIFRSATRLRGFVGLPGGELHAPEILKDKPVLAFCGIGNPAAFFRNAREWGVQVVEEVTFPDHHAYDGREMARLEIRARERGAAALVTTEKDAVNLPPAPNTSIPIFAVAIELELSDAEAFEEVLLERLGAVKVEAG